PFELSGLIRLLTDGSGGMQAPMVKAGSGGQKGPRLTVSNVISIILRSLRMLLRAFSRVISKSRYIHGARRPSRASMSESADNNSFEIRQQKATRSIPSD